MNEKEQREIENVVAGQQPEYRRLADIVALAVKKAVDQGRDEVAEHLMLCYNDILKQDSHNAAARREGEDLDEIHKSSASG